MQHLSNFYHLTEIQQRFEKRFQDFNLIKNDLIIFNDSKIV